METWVEALLRLKNEAGNELDGFNVSQLNPDTGNNLYSTKSTFFNILTRVR